MISPHFYFMGVDQLKQVECEESLPLIREDRAEQQVQWRLINPSQLGSQRGKKAGIYFKKPPPKPVFPSDVLYISSHFIYLKKIHVPTKDVEVPYVVI